MSVNPFLTDLQVQQILENFKENGNNGHGTMTANLVYSMLPYFNSAATFPLLPLHLDLLSRFTANQVEQSNLMSHPCDTSWRVQNFTPSACPVLGHRKDSQLYANVSPEPASDDDSTQKNKRRKLALRLCHGEGCKKYAQGGTNFCVSHGGGRRCQTEGCKISARGKSGLCIKHGGGKRCSYEDCMKSAIGATNFCVRHGGGRRCSVDGCGKSAQGATHFCVRHGSGRQCEASDCEEAAKPRSKFCASHCERRKLNLDLSDHE